MHTSVSLTLNGRRITLNTDDDRTLLWVLRTELGLTGTKYGCGVGVCGACTVVVGQRAVRACRTPLKAVAGQEVLTVEGLAGDTVLHPLQQAFLEHGAFQCGYCTPGMLMTAYALLRAQPHASRATILAQLEHQLCRCGAHQRIVRAVESVAGQPVAAP